MCVTYLSVLNWGDIFSKKVFLVIPIVIVALILVMPISSTYDFDGHFTMDVPLAKHYSDVAWCRPNGALGCAAEYWEDSAGCELDGNEFIVYYVSNFDFQKLEFSELKQLIDSIRTENNILNRN